MTSWQRLNDLEDSYHPRIEYGGVTAVRPSSVDITTTNNSMVNDAVANNRLDPDGNESPSATSNTEPKPLPVEQRHKPVVLVHIGKAGGSSIRALVKECKNQCQQQQQQQQPQYPEDYDNATLQPNPYYCAMAQITDDVFYHMKGVYWRRDDIGNYDRFLVTIRNPLSRLASWYDYESKLYYNNTDMRRKYRRWERKAEKTLLREQERPLDNVTAIVTPNFVKLLACYPTFDDLALFDQQRLEVATTNATATDPTTADTTGNDSCRRLARQCLLGDIMCFSHNYYNYEMYLEELLLWRGLSTVSTTVAFVESSRANDATLRRRSSSSNDTIRIDVIRAEHSWNDLSRTLLLWTATGPEEDDISTTMNLTTTTTTTSTTTSTSSYASDILSLYGNHNAHGNEPSSRDTSASSPKIPSGLSREGAEALCRLLCIELLSYKSILAVADNLHTSEKQRSHQELDDACGGISVHENCGGGGGGRTGRTVLQYRNVKDRRNVSVMPW